MGIPVLFMLRCEELQIKVRIGNSNINTSSGVRSNPTPPPPSLHIVQLYQEPSSVSECYLPSMEQPHSSCEGIKTEPHSPAFTTVKPERSLPYVKILEQPISHTRFRFPSEKSVEKILGEHSSARKKTYPKIQILDCDPGTWHSAMVVVSCVSHNSAIPFIHPHNLVSPAKVRIITF